MQLTTDPYTCEKCGETYGRDCQDPVTVNGWYGNEHCDWVQRGSVMTVKVTETKCPKCGHVQKP